MSATGLSATVSGAVADTIARLGWAIDAADGDGVAKCFTPTGTQVGGSGHTATGHDELRAFGTALAAGRAPGSIVRHHCRNVTVLEHDDHRARVRTIFLATVLKPGEPTSLLATGYYDDQFVQHDGAWLVDHRVVNVEVAG